MQLSSPTRGQAGGGTAEGRESDVGLMGKSIWPMAALCEAAEDAANWAWTWMVGAPVTHPVNGTIGRRLGSDCEERGMKQAAMSAHRCHPDI